MIRKKSFICVDFVDDIRAVLWGDIWFHTHRPLLVVPTPSDRWLCGTKPDDCPLIHTVHFHSPGCLAHTPSETKKKNEKEIHSKISTTVFGGGMMFIGTQSIVQGVKRICKTFLLVKGIHPYRSVKLATIPRYNNHKQDHNHRLKVYSSPQHYHRYCVSNYSTSH